MEKKKTRTIEGWVGRSNDLEWWWEPEEMMITVSKKRGLKEKWPAEDWPPRKVRIIAEGGN